jgi:DNA processing protein
MTVTDTERLARVTLTHLAEPGDRHLGRLVAEVGPVAAVETVRTGTTSDEDLHAAIPRWAKRLAGADPAASLAACDRLGGRVICPGDVEWPSQLDDLGPGRPHALWVLGDLDLRFGCLKSVAVVGSRSASPYGVHVAAEMGADLAERGWLVVSGGAFGIDAAAHRGALAAEGSTLAVLAFGIDIAYPRAHLGLFSEIAAEGLLVSEVPPGVTPIRSRFLVRNRVIAALTRGTVVVEAGLRSGATNTATHARALSRAVMFVPGPVTSQMSAGCHRLLRDWGESVCVTDAAEVLDLVGSVGEDLAPARPGPVVETDRLEPATREVLEAIPARGGASTAKIALTVGIELDAALSRLGALAAAGFIQRADRGWKLRKKGIQS